MFLHYLENTKIASFHSNAVLGLRLCQTPTTRCLIS